MMTVTSFRPLRLVTRAAVARRALAVFAAVASTQTPRFYDDDPIAREPESQDASKAQPYRPAVVRADVRPVRRHLATSRRASARRTSTRSTRCRTRAGSPTASARPRSRPTSSCAGPNIGAPPDPSKWIVIREKTSGVHPGFTARDGKGETWFLEFDPPYFPEGATVGRRDREPRSSGRSATTRSRPT